MISLCLLWLTLGLQTISWPEAAVTLGLAINTTLSGFLLQKRMASDKVQEARFYDLRLRLARIERRCYGEATETAEIDT